MVDARVNAAETDPLRALAREVADLKRQITELRAARRLSASAIDASDGSLRVVDGGVEILRVGDLGAPFRGVEIRRRTGDQAMSAWSTAPGDPGFVAPLWDLSGNYVITDDVGSRRGLGRPYLCFSMGDALSQPTATTNLSTFTILASGVSALENPGLYAMAVWRSSAADTTGQIQLAVDGTLIGSPTNIAGNDFIIGFLGPTAHGVTDYAGIHRIDLMAKRTAGTGNIGARVLGVMGLESSWL